jgi:tetratricopeptide (TPR) repeat protein
MKNTIICLLVCLFAFLSRCGQKKGVDELVFITDANRAPDEVYIDYLTDAIDRDPKGTDKYLKLADIYKNRNQSAQALALLQNAEEKNPDNVEILLGIAEMHLENRDAKALSKTLNKIRKTDPDNIEFLKLSAAYSLLRKDYTNAVFFANRAMLTNPYDDEILYLRGSAMLINFDSINALQSFEEAYNLKNSHKNFSELFGLAITLNKTDEAKKYLDDFSSKNPDAQLCFEEGVFLHKKGALDSAKTVLKGCLPKSDNKPKINYELAKIYFEENLTDSAGYYVNLYLGNKPSAVNGYILKGEILEKMNQYSNAEEFYKRALEIDSTHRLASMRLENLERKIAYLQLLKRKENVQRQVEELKPLNSKVIK